MKKVTIIFLTLLLQFNIYASPRKVLVELLTNSHCPLCPPAHNALDSYFANGKYKDRIILISYHMVFPYSDDPLYLQNTADAAARNSFYGPYSSTPQGFFNGTHQSSNYAGWSASIDSKAEEDSPFEITLTGSGSTSSATVSASVKQTGATGASNLSVYFVAVENVSYTGRNGISYHKNVMRKMPSANALQISLNETVKIDQMVDLSNGWSKAQLGFAVFIQDNSTKAVYQAEYISYLNLTATSVGENPQQKKDFVFAENYPNPFNPKTTITYHISDNGFVQLKIYDLLGREIAEIENGFKSSGTHTIDFDASSLNSGLYFYKLTSGKQTYTGKMILQK